MSHEHDNDLGGGGGAGGGGLSALLSSASALSLPLPALPSLPSYVWEGVVGGMVELLPAGLRPASRTRTQFFSCESLPQLDVPTTSSKPAAAASAAAASIKALPSIAIVDGAGAWRAKLLAPASLGLSLGGVVSAAAGALSPQGGGCCDFNRTERIANLVSSLPYAWIGHHALRHRKSRAGRAWGVGMFGVCAASTAFHASSGRFRELGRRVDYWTIAVASGLLTRALYPSLPPVLTAASVAATPFAPFAVTTTNALALEGAFLARALQNPDLRGAQKLHSAACVAGMAVFSAEEASVPHVPLVHASWHLLSAISTAMVNCCLADVERQQQQEQRDGGGGGVVMTTPAGAGAAWGRRQQEQEQEQQWRRLCVTPLSLADGMFQRGGSGGGGGGGTGCDCGGAAGCKVSGVCGAKRPRLRRAGVACLADAAAGGRRWLRSIGGVRWEGVQASGPGCVSRGAAGR